MRRLLGILLTLLCLAAVTTPISSVSAASVKLNKKKITLNRGETFQLKLEGAKSDKVTWNLSDSGYFLVDDNGTVFAWPGSYESEKKVTVIASYKGKDYKCEVVSPAVKAKVPKEAMLVGDTFRLGFEGGTWEGAEILSSYTPSKKEWVSGKINANKIMTIDDNGLVKAVGVGKVNLTVYSAVGYKQDVVIEVRNPKTEVEKSYDKLAKWLEKNGERSGKTYDTYVLSGDGKAVTSIEYEPENERFYFTYYNGAESNRENAVRFSVNMSEVRESDNYSVDYNYYYIHLNSYGLETNTGYTARATLIPLKYKKGSNFGFAVTGRNGYTADFVKGKISTMESMGKTLLSNLNSSLLPKAGLKLKDIGFKSY